MAVEVANDCVQGCVPRSFGAFFSSITRARHLLDEEQFPAIPFGKDDDGKYWREDVIKYTIMFYELKRGDFFFTRVLSVYVVISAIYLSSFYICTKRANRFILNLGNAQ